MQAQQKRSEGLGARAYGIGDDFPPGRCCIVRAQQKGWKSSPGLASFLAAYHELLVEFVAPQFEGETSILYQKVPVVRPRAPAGHLRGLALPRAGPGQELKGLLKP